ncbi:unnamed protein product [Vitrella brassicaformis CCMP3155]|uniref:tyrosine--tRNA ligase n=2 Tax=Vitrella brassicaformis TaxID=1169539 RepID=A0A0G4EVQ9_VITBC|nr:unnamed protein product [Vitrella brassicaformis CCMP3155]|eukprot:CEM02181.1 unnamed protein product [Vitrella brassicaformis CCMP3155]
MTSPLHGGLGGWEGADQPNDTGAAVAVEKMRRDLMAAKATEPSAAAPDSAKRASKEMPKTAATESPPSAPVAVNGAACADGVSEGCSTRAVIGSDVRWPAPVPSTLSLDERFALCRSVGAECIQEDELRALLEKKAHPICYDGFEPSGRMHIAQGILKAINVNKLTKCGCVFVFWVADWFAMLNNKLGGDINKIRKTGEYFIEVWKAAGMDMTNVRFLWASDEINKNSNQYWMRVMDIARKFNITRIKRCGQIMGRGEGDDQPSAQIMYPCMQCSDIFELKADICQLGLDQRKVNMLAREYCDELKMKHKPIILSHGMLPGLLEGQEKMSKSDPDSAIFMEDLSADVNRKIKKAFCPPQVLEGNPCMSYIEHMVFPMYGEFRVDRRDQDGGPITYTSFAQCSEDYLSGRLHPGDVKPNLSRYINEMLEPVRRHFQDDPHAKKLLATIKAYKVTK